MAGGPIQRERDAWKPPVVTTNPAESVHAAGERGRAYCGHRKPGAVSTKPDEWTCSACLAAVRADA